MYKIRRIPESDLKVSNCITSLEDDEYKDGVFCSCDMSIIKFKNREPHEVVLIKCPTCGKEIIYG